MGIFNERALVLGVEVTGPQAVAVAVAAASAAAEPGAPVESPS